MTRPGAAFLLLTALLALSGPAAAEDPPAAGIEWLSDLDAALARSREEGRPVIAYFTFDT